MFVVTLVKRDADNPRDFFNIALFENEDHADTLARAYQNALETGYELCGVRLLGSNTFRTIYVTGSRRD